MKKGLIFRKIGAIVIGVIEQTNKADKQNRGENSRLL